LDGFHALTVVRWGQEAAGAGALRRNL
jgi:hypothetical protein